MQSLKFTVTILAGFWLELMLLALLLCFMSFFVHTCLKLCFFVCLSISGSWKNINERAETNAVLCNNADYLHGSMKLGKIQFKREDSSMKKLIQGWTFRFISQNLWLGQHQCKHLCPAMLGKYFALHSLAFFAPFTVFVCAAEWEFDFPKKKLRSTEPTKKNFLCGSSFIFWPQNYPSMGSFLSLSLSMCVCL